MTSTARQERGSPWRNKGITKGFRHLLVAICPTLLEAVMSLGTPHKDFFSSMLVAKSSLLLIIDALAFVELYGRSEAWSRM